MTPSVLIGRIVNDAGDAIAGATVVATSDHFFQRHPIEAELLEGKGLYANVQVTETDSEGLFEFSEHLVPGNDLSVSVLADGYAPLRFPHERLARDAPHDMGNLVVHKGYSVSGTVVSEQGEPLAGVQVLMALERGVPGNYQSFPGRGMPLTRTDAEGRFTADGLLPGRWYLLFDKTGYRVVEQQGNFFNHPHPEPLAITLDHGRSISGRVTNVPEAYVGQLMVEARPIRRKVDYVKQFPSRGRPRRAHVQADGSFHIEGLSEAAFQPNIHPFVVQGYHSQITTQPGPLEAWLVVGLATDPNQRLVELPEVQSCRVEAGRSDVELPWLGRVSFSARIVDELGEPVEAQSVEVRYESGFGLDRDIQQATLLPGGRVELRDYAAWDSHLNYWTPERRVCLWIQAVGFEFCEVAIHDKLIRGQPIDFGDIPLKATPLIRVRVVDSAGKAVPRAEVRLAAAKGWPALLTRWAYQHQERVPGSWDWNFPYHGLITHTNDNGEALLSQVDEGAEILSVSHPEYAFQVHPIESTNDADDLPQKKYPAEIRLASPGRITVKVVDDDGRSAPWRPVLVETLAPKDPTLVAPHTDSELRGDQFEATTDSHGTATFDRLHGRFLVSLKHPERKRRHRNRIEKSERSIVDVSGRDVEVTLTAWPLCEFSVSVRESDRPVVGGSLQMMSEYLCTPDASYKHLPFKGFTGDRGCYRFRDVPPGDYVLHLNHDDRNMIAHRKIRVEPGMGPIDWLLDNNTITGKLVDRDGGPIPHKCIGIKAERQSCCGGNDAGITYETGRGNLDWFWSGPWIHETWTDADGNFHLRGLIANVPLYLYTSHNTLIETRLDLEPLKDGERRDGITLVAARAGSFRMVGTKQLPHVDEVEYRALMFPLDDVGDPMREQMREKTLPYPYPIESCSVGPWLIVIERAGDGDSWDEVSRTRVMVVAAATQEVKVVASDV